jgi:hypothetical protein
MAAEDFTAAAFIGEVPTPDSVFRRIPEAEAAFLRREVLRAAVTARELLALCGV